MSLFDGRASLYAEVRPALVRYVARLSGDQDLAEDIAQEAFLRLAERPMADERNVRGWLFTVATNLLRDDHRTTRRRANLALAAPDRISADPPADPAAHAMGNDARARVRAALHGLSEKEQTALLMREEGFSHREIADAVNTTTKSVGTLLARALEKMARRLAGEEA